MIVLIDDERSFIEDPDIDFIVLRNSREALEWLEQNHSSTVIEEIWFDHDLGMVDGETDSTIPVLRRIEELCFFGNAPKISQVIVHTSNPVGGKEIQKSLDRYYPTLRVFAGDYLTVR